MTPEQKDIEIHRLNNCLQTMATARELDQVRLNRATFDAAEAIKDRDYWYRKVLELELSLQTAGRAVEQEHAKVLRLETLLESFQIPEDLLEEEGA